MRTASVVKVMMLVAYLRQGEVRDRELRESERALLSPMIRRSDNTAASTIFSRLGREPIEELADDAGMKHFAYSSPVWGRCRTSARDQARLMRRFERYIPRRHEDFARRQLNSVVKSQRWGVAEAKPKGWGLYFKGGWGRGIDGTDLQVDHQVAFLDRREQRVSIVILIDSSPSQVYGNETLEGVARRLLRDLPR